MSFPSIQLKSDMPWKLLAHGRLLKFSVIHFIVFCCLDLCLLKCGVELINAPEVEVVTMLRGCIRRQIICHACILKHPDSAAM